MKSLITGNKIIDEFHNQVSNMSDEGMREVDELNEKFKKV